MGFAALICILGLGWIGTANDWAMFKVFAPKMEQVRRETFEQSKAYNQGMIQDLRGMQIEYIQAPKDAKGAIGSVILHRYADYPNDKLPEDLQVFMSELRHKANIE